MLLFDWIDLNVKRMIDSDVLMMLLKKYFEANIKVDP
jgi:hypothetical protein